MAIRKKVCEPCVEEVMKDRIEHCRKIKRLFFELAALVSEILSEVEETEERAEKVIKRRKIKRVG